MKKISHGDALPLVPEAVAQPTEENMSGPATELSPVTVQPTPFKYIFDDLAEDKNKNNPLLSKSAETVKYLKELGQEKVMKDDFSDEGVSIPTIYTFFGQFVDHDITHEAGTHDKNLSAADLVPLTYEEAMKLQNGRSPNLDLDSVYGSPSGVRPPLDLDVPNKLRIDRVSKPEGLPAHTKNEFNDLPREAPDTTDPRHDRAALIGDKRNDENIITAQLHVAFLHAHNAIVDKGYDFKQARILLIKHYQWIVLNDYLPRITKPAILKQIRQGGPKFFNPTKAEEIFTPLEFSVAAYRFGHSKIRPSYEGYNSRQVSATLDQLFTFSRFGGSLGISPRLPHIPGTWVIDWKNFLDSDNKMFFSRPIDTTLTPILFHLQGEPEEDLEQQSWKTNLAVRNLLRGYYLRLPTGQAIATAMQAIMPEIEPLPPDAIKWAVPEMQRPILKKANFLENTPLWFYILVEAKIDNGGKHLGPVGSVIVAETLIGMLRHSEASIWPWPKDGEPNLPEPNWKPTLGLTPGKFDLKDLLILAGVYKAPDPA
jgi:hypothetical protein